jgi:hypothetical protein
VPFLPLEKKHVQNCARAELRKYDFNKSDMKRLQENFEKDVDEIADEMVYEKVMFNRFSTSGCKRVPNLVRNLIVQRNYQLKDEL